MRAGDPGQRAPVMLVGLRGPGAGEEHEGQKSEEEPATHGTRYLPATEETYFATAWICAARELARERRHDSAANRHLVEDDARTSAASSWSRFGPTVRLVVIPASLSVWQLPQAALDDRLAVGPERRKVDGLV